MTFETVENWALHAFADGELEGDERKAMERLLSENEEARKALAAINYQKSELRIAYGPVLGEPLPLSLIATVQGRGGRSILPYAAMAASVALVLIGGAGGWYSSQHSESVQTADLAHRALIAHEIYSVEVRHPVEVAAAEQDHLQAWLSKRVGTAIKIPNLDTEGFTLLGGRLVTAGDSPAGQLMYETADKQRLTIFIAANTDSKDSALRLVENGKLITCYWRDNKLALAVTGDLAKEDMMVLAKNIYEQMDVKS
jgi:anti-sigma factor RsiW